MSALDRRTFLRSLVSAGVALPFSAHANPFLGPSRFSSPNVLLIVADDLGWDDVGFDGRKTWSTPNLDSLCAQGTRFTRFYSGGAVCCPARACLLTGKYTIHDGVKGYTDALPAKEVTIAAALKQLGYDTAMYGKWDSGQGLGPLDRGFDEFTGFMNDREAWQHFPKTLHHNREEIPIVGYSADIFSDAAINYIERKRSRPFFMYLAYTEPHSIIEAPKDAVSTFQGRFPEKNKAEPWNATYPAMINRMDRGIGRVLDALRRTGQESNTLVIFSSDQGATFEPRNKGASYYHDSNYPFRGQKRTLLEGGIRVPGVVRWPNEVPAGTSSHAVVHFIDILPTVMAAAGGHPSPEWQVDGMNLLQVWRGRATPPPRTLFWEWAADKGNYAPDYEGVRMSPDAEQGLVWYAAMRGDLKLLDVNGARSLFNVESDPAERKNLAMGDPDAFASLQQQLNDWRATDVTRKHA